MSTRPSSKPLLDLPQSGQPPPGLAPGSWASPTAWESACIYASSYGEEKNAGKSVRLLVHRVVISPQLLRTLRRLRWMFLLLALCSVPYLVTVNCSVFTDYVHRHRWGGIWGGEVSET